MARFARVVAPGCPHHVTHRGNRRDPVFFADDDREEYLALLHDACAHYGVAIWAYCLLTNHVHLIAVPSHADALGLALGRAHMTYARHANRRQRWWGHLWANRFYSTPLDEAHAWTAIKYVERNPVRAGLVDLPWDYPWSSAPTHVLGVPAPLLSAVPPDDTRAPGAAWGAWLLGPEVEEDVQRLRANTTTGWPTGAPAFVTALETRLDRRLTRQPAGRKAKAVDST